MDSLLIAALASQLTRLGGAVQRGEEVTPTRGCGRENGVAAAVAAHARFLMGLCDAFDDDAPWCVIYTRLSAEHSHYLRVVFPRARFVFLHRNPVDMLRLHLWKSELALDQRHDDLSAHFADHWRRLAVGLDEATAEVGALMLSYDEVISANCTKLEEYLGVHLLPLDGERGAETRASDSAELHPSTLMILLERVGGIATRLGYRLDHPRRAEPRPPSEAPRSAPYQVPTSGAAGASQCAVLVPTMRYIEPECDESLMELERRGYAVIRLRGCLAIDHARSRMATLALEQGFEETLWVDADVSFDPDDVDRLRAHKLPIVAGIYARKRPRGGFAMAPLPGTREVTMGEGGGLVEVLYAGTGFLLVRRGVYVAIQQRFNLPLCDGGRAHRAIPFFMPMLEEWGGTMSQLGEDYAFSRRARLCGYKIMADASIRLWHIGSYHYGYEDAGTELERLASYRHTLKPHDGRG